MAAGDAQRTWFPEMIERLRCQWRGDMGFDALVELRDELEAMLGQIRSGRQIRSPIVKCSRCGYVGEGAAPHVSVRAMILSLRRFGIAPAEEVFALEKSWAAQRKLNGLDLYGKKLEAGGAETAPAAGCGHT